MKLLSRLAGLLTALLVTVVALASTAYAMLPPGDPSGSGRPVLYDAPPAPPVVVDSGPSLLQVAALMLLAALIAAVLTVFTTRHVWLGGPVLR